MEKVRPWCGRPSDRRRLKNSTDTTVATVWLHCNIDSRCGVQCFARRLTDSRRRESALWLLSCRSHLAVNNRSPADASTAEAAAAAEKVPVDELVNKSTYVSRFSRPTRERRRSFSNSASRLTQYSVATNILRTASLLARDGPVEYRHRSIPLFKFLKQNKP